MNRFIKNVLLYLLLIVAAVTVLDSFSNINKSSSDITFSSFLQQVKEKKLIVLLSQQIIVLKES